MTAPRNSDLPRVAVIIPALNEERFIGRCLAKLRQLDYPADRVEFVVVDNGSRDRTSTIATELGYRVVALPGVKVGAVRNYGVQQSDSEYVAFIDADCVAKTTWLSAAIDEFGGNPETGATGGSYLVEDSATWIERAWGGLPSAHRREVSYLAGGSLILRRALFLELGGFSSEMSAGEDEDLCRRVRDAGYKIVSLPASAVYHLGFPRQLNDVYRRQRWQGSNQLDTPAPWRDKTVISVHIFAFGLVALALLLAWGMVIPAAGIAAVCLVGVPLAAALYRRTVIRNRRERLLRPMQLWLVFLFYYFGRSAGLVINYWRRITRSQGKQFR